MNTTEQVMKPLNVVARAYLKKAIYLAKSRDLSRRNEVVLALRKHRVICPYCRMRVSQCVVIAETI